MKNTFLELDEPEEAYNVPLGMGGVIGFRVLGMGGVISGPESAVRTSPPCPM